MRTFFASKNEGSDNGAETGSRHAHVPEVVDRDAVPPSLAEEGVRSTKSWEDVEKAVAKHRKKLADAFQAAERERGKAPTQLNQEVKMKN